MKRNLTPILTGLAFAGGLLGARAQTDVTATYLSDADFSAASVLANGVCTYDYDCTENGTDLSGMQYVDEHWQYDAEAGNARAAGVFAYGGEAFLGTVGLVPPTAGPDGEAGNALGLLAVWQADVQYTQAATLPKGTYTLTIPVYNISGATAFTKSLIGFIEDDGTEHLCSATAYAVGEWTEQTYTFSLTEETAGYFSLGYQSANYGSGNMPHLLVDRVDVSYTDAVLTQDFLPTAVSVSEDDVLERLSQVTLTFGERPYRNTTLSDAFQVLDAEGNSVTTVSLGTTSSALYVRFASAITAAGTYRLVIAEGAIGNSAYSESGYTFGSCNPQLTYTFTITPADAIASVQADEAAAQGVRTLAGQLVRRDASDLDGLPRGIYLVDGRKVLVR